MTKKGKKIDFFTSKSESISVKQSLTNPTNESTKTLRKSE